MSLNAQQPGDQDKTETMMPVNPGSDARKHTGRTIGIILTMLLILAGGAFTSFYTVPAGYQGVIMRFGKFSGIVLSGPHLKVPFGVDKVIEVNTDTIESESFGFRSGKPGIRNRYRKDPESMKESLMLTGDLSIVDLEWSVHYKRQDPKKFLLGIHDSVQSIRDISESVMRGVVSDRSFDYVLKNREEISRIFIDELQRSLDRYDSGIKVVDVRLRNVLPPDQVRDAYNEVNAARQEKESLINQALEAYNREIPKARGEAAGLVNMAQGYALERANVAKGETSRFNDVLHEYRNAKEVTRKRLYLETCREVLPKARQVQVIDSRQKNVFPLFDSEKRMPGTGGER